MESMVKLGSRETFWLGKRVFLTGHTGFKGCWLKIMLEALGAVVFGYSLAPEPYSLYRAIWGDTCDGGVFADIRDASRLKREITGFAPEIVFHLAAQPLVRASYADPVHTYETNVMGTAHVLEAIRATVAVKSAVVITTDKCYKNREWEWGYRENDELGGADPYSSSKACVELLCNAWRDSYLREQGVSLATARAGNVIGGGDWACDRIVPDIVRAFVAREVLSVRMPKAIRPWQHVLEPLWGYLLLAEQLSKKPEDIYAAAWNFGPPAENARTVEEVIQTAMHIWGKDAEYCLAESAIAHETHSLRLDSSKAVQHLAWENRYDFDQAMAHTIGWYKRFYAGEHALSITREQVEAYLGKVLCDVL